MTKTPFELRFDLLSFAQGSLTSEYHAKIEEIARFPDKTAVMPKYPTKDDVFRLAEEYKSFIERK